MELVTVKKGEKESGCLPIKLLVSRIIRWEKNHASPLDHLK